MIKTCRHTLASNLVYNSRFNFHASATQSIEQDSEDDEDFDLFDDIQEVLSAEESQKQRIDQIMQPTETDQALLIPP